MVQQWSSPNHVTHVRLSALLAISVVAIAVGALPCVVQALSQRVEHPAVGFAVRPPSAPQLLHLLGRNLGVAAFVYLGRYTLGTMSLFGLVAVGYAFAESLCSAIQRGIPGWYLWAALLPHGLVEMAGICLAGAIGLTGFTTSRNTDAHMDGRRLRRCTAVAAALITTAALIECFVTPSVIAAVAAKYRN